MPGVYKASRRRSLCSLSHSAPAGPQVFPVTLSSSAPAPPQPQVFPVTLSPTSATGVPCHTQPRLSHRCSLSHSAPAGPQVFPVTLSPSASAPPRPQVFSVTLSPGWATGVPCHTQPQCACPASATGSHPTACLSASSSFGRDLASTRRPHHCPPGPAQTLRRASQLCLWPPWSVPQTARGVLVKPKQVPALPGSHLAESRNAQAQDWP
ncbi:nascent polypeptide-associated complex subunit alpha, muscle-specific form-like isoform X4 [Symphalangus syndactylus]|uniref:nascent polypeptide-associated complex subunit alpha, muscle-specific form-like isoform X4 n=1 Tax=Symphalangus syndactylus TaxID=9590 RepID=UPI003007EB13